MEKVLLKFEFQGNSWKIIMMLLLWRYQEGGFDTDEYDINQQRTDDFFSTIKRSLRGLEDL